MHQCCWQMAWINLRLEASSFRSTYTEICTIFRKIGVNWNVQRSKYTSFETAIFRRNPISGHQMHVYRDTCKFKWHLRAERTTCKVVIARYRFSADLVKTLPIDYFMLLEYVQSFKIIDYSESEKIKIGKKLGREVKYGIPYAMLKLDYISHHSNWIFLSTLIKLFFKVESCFTLHLARFRDN